MQYRARASSQLNTLLKPVFSSTPINYFSYCRLYADRTADLIISNPDIYQLYLDENHLRTTLGQCHFESLESGSMLLSDKMQPELAQTLDGVLDRDFDVGHYLVLKNKTKDYCDIYTFGCSSRNLQTDTFYLNQANFLNDFVTFIGRTLRYIIKYNELEPIAVPLVQVGNTFDGYQQSYSVNDLYVLAQTKTKALFIKDGMRPRYLTNREHECLKYFLGNFTAKEVARIVGISHRTVEHHFASIKAKLGCTNKKELFQLFNVA